jgi:LPXTG-motif cell wall-anchored protein
MNVAMLRGVLKFHGKEDTMAGPTVVQIIAGVLAVAVLGLIVYRRKQKAV